MAWRVEKKVATLILKNYILLQQFDIVKKNVQPCCSIKKSTHVFIDISERILSWLRNCASKFNTEISIINSESIKKLPFYVLEVE